jgi:hypothetical protein
MKKSEKKVSKEKISKYNICHEIENYEKNSGREI